MNLRRLSSIKTISKSLNQNQTSMFPMQMPTVPEKKMEKTRSWL
jgi:hypothetical protein